MVKTEVKPSASSKILAAAKRVFIRKGLTGARMQDIADEAGMNKALLHYYFRNKESLFEQVFLEAAQHLIPRVHEVLNADLPLLEKIRSFCELYIDMVMENPQLPMFVLNEIHQDPELFLKKVLKGRPKPTAHRFLEQLREEIKKGNIREVQPAQLLLHLVSLTIFPVLAMPMLQRTLDLTDAQYWAMIAKRKQEIPEFILHSLRP